MTPDELRQDIELGRVRGALYVRDSLDDLGQREGAYANFIYGWVQSALREFFDDPTFTLDPASDHEEEETR